MKLFEINHNKLSPVRTKPFKLERDIQQLVEQNVEALFGLEFVKSELSIQNFRFDTLCYDTESNAFVVIEYKKGSSYSVIDQGYTYLSTLLNNKADFILEYNEIKDKALKRDEIDWSQSRIIFVSPKFTDYQKNSINFKNIPFDLYEITRFENETIGLTKLETNSEVNISTITSGVDNVVNSVSTEVKKYDEEYHLSGLRGQKDLEELYFILKERILALDSEITIVGRSMFLAFRLKSSFFDVAFQKKGLWCWLNLKKGQLNDPNNLCRDVSSIGHYGNGDYELRINTKSDLDYVMFLIKQSYEKQG